MKAIIPVAGYGTRLRPHSDKIQKTLLPVAGRPGLDYIVKPLIDAGITNITFIIGHLGEQVKKHMQQYSGNFSFIVQTERLGLGHAVLLGLDDSDAPVLIQLGDTIFDIDYGKVLNYQVNKIAVGEVADPSRFGIVETAGIEIIAFYEKDPNPPSNLAINGLYLFSNQRVLKQAIEQLIARDIKTKGEYQLTDALELMLSDGQIFEILPINKWYDLGVPETYLETNRKLLIAEHKEYPQVEIIDPVYISHNTTIKSSRIGPGVTVMENCEIRNCVIDNSIVLKDSKLTGLTIHGKIIAGDGSDIC